MQSTVLPSRRTPCAFVCDIALSASATIADASSSSASKHAALIAGSPNAIADAFEGLTTVQTVNCAPCSAAKSAAMSRAYSDVSEPSIGHRMDVNTVFSNHTSGFMSLLFVFRFDFDGQFA